MDFADPAMRTMLMDFAMCSVGHTVERGVTVERVIGHTFDGAQSPDDDRYAFYGTGGALMWLTGRDLWILQRDDGLRGLMDRLRATYLSTRQPERGWQNRACRRRFAMVHAARRARR